MFKCRCLVKLELSGDCSTLAMSFSVEMSSTHLNNRVPSLMSMCNDFPCCPSCCNRIHRAESGLTW